MCPYCKAAVIKVTLKEIAAQALLGPPWQAVSYSCGSCGQILSVGIDPVALQDDTVQAILAALGKR
jgi:hypothetical protein